MVGRWRRTGRSRAWPREQMIMHVPGARVPDALASAGGGVEPPACFGVDATLPGQAQRHARGSKPGQGSSANGGSRKIDVEPAPFARATKARASPTCASSPAMPIDAAARGQRRDQRAACGRPRPPAPRRAKRLERQHAGAGVELERRRAGQVLAQPVEQRLAHAVRRRAKARRRGKRERAGRDGAADDANAGWARPRRDASASKGGTVEFQFSRAASIVPAGAAPPSRCSISSNASPRSGPRPCRRRLAHWREATPGCARAAAAGADPEEPSARPARRRKAQWSERLKAGLGCRAKS